VAHESNLQLPAIAVGRSEVVRLQRELEALGDYLHQAALRKVGSNDIKLPKTSRLLDEFMALNKLDLLHRDQHDQAAEGLREIVTRAPRLHISFSAEPSSAFLAKLVGWLRENIDPTVLVQVGLQPGIAAGCIVRTPNRQFDLSLGQSFEKNRELLLGQLRGEAVTQ
jgi:F0F1-type ATP synthase delta subunit